MISTVCLLFCLNLISNYLLCGCALCFGCVCVNASKPYPTLAGEDERSVCQQLERAANLRGLWVLVPTTGAGQGHWGLLLERMRRPTAAVTHISCVPYCTSRLQSQSAEEEEQDWDTCAVRVCLRAVCVQVGSWERQCFLSVSTCAAGWVCSVSAHMQPSGVGAQPLYCLQPGTGNCSSLASVGLGQEEIPWLPVPIRFRYL